MTSRQFITARSSEDLDSFFPLLQVLRPHLKKDDYLKIYQQAHQSDGYELVALIESGKILGLIGFRFLSDFVRGRHVYVDDLVIDESQRSKGLGLVLLDYADQIAKKENCTTVRLCAGVENERGIQFYERNGWSKRAFAYVRKLS